MNKILVNGIVIGSFDSVDYSTVSNTVKQVESVEYIPGDYTFEVSISRTEVFTENIAKTFGFEQWKN